MRGDKLIEGRQYDVEHVLPITRLCSLHRTVRFTLTLFSEHFVCLTMMLFLSGNSHSLIYLIFIAVSYVLCMTLLQYVRYLVLIVLCLSIDTVGNILPLLLYK